MSNFGMTQGLRYYCKDCGSDKIIFRAAGADEVELVANALQPVTANGAALGGASNEWSDLYLADAGVVSLL